MNSDSPSSSAPAYVAQFQSVAIIPGQQPASSSTWTDAGWDRAGEARVAHFFSESSSHRPTSIARLLHDESFFYLRFDVIDRYVIAQARAHQDDVYKDSCVEFFVRPPGAKGYFNFEFNCGGTMLASFIEYPARDSPGVKKARMIDAVMLDQIAIAHTLPKNIDPELRGPVDWKLCARIPFSLIRHYAGNIEVATEGRWSCNFYKCVESNSHPHWAAWAPMGDTLDFHQPDRFGRLVLDER